VINGCPIARPITSLNRALKCFVLRDTGDVVVDTVFSSRRETRVVGRDKRVKVDWLGIRFSPIINSRWWWLGSAFRWNVIPSADVQIRKKEKVCVCVTLRRTEEICVLVLFASPCLDR
jgi:hypothetical protein